MSGSEQFIDDNRNREPLLETEEHFRAMAEAATDGIITINSESIILQLRYCLE